MLFPEVLANTAAGCLVLETAKWFSFSFCHLSVCLQRQFRSNHCWHCGAFLPELSMTPKARSHAFGKIAWMFWLHATSPLNNNIGLWRSSSSTFERILAVLYLPLRSIFIKIIEETLFCVKPCALASIHHCYHSTKPCGLSNVWLCSTTYRLILTFTTGRW